MTVERHRRVQQNHVGARYRSEGAVGKVVHPGDRTSVIEPQHQLGPHSNSPAFAADDPDDVRITSTRRHEVDDLYRALRRLDTRFEDQLSSR